MLESMNQPSDSFNTSVIANPDDQEDSFEMGQRRELPHNRLHVFPLVHGLGGDSRTLTHPYDPTASGQPSRIERSAVCRSMMEGTIWSPWTAPTIETANQRRSKRSMTPDAQPANSRT